VTRLGERLTVLGFAAAVVGTIVALAFAVGYVIGRLLL
jgi:hypothetical protein